MLASAEAYDSSEPCEGCLPHSLSTIVCFSLEAIDITAALARCAISRTEAPGVFAAGLASACFAAGVGAGTFSASWAGAGCGAVSFGFGASASFGVSIFFGASTGVASATCVASIGLGASPCGAEAANLSLNIIEGGAVSGAEIFGGRAGSEANTSLKVGGAERTATTLDCLTRGTSNAALFIDG